MSNWTHTLTVIVPESLMTLANQTVAAGFDPYKYGILSYDSWDDIYEDEFVESSVDVVDEDGNVIGIITELVKTGNQKLVMPAGELYRINYEELLMLKEAANKRRFTAIETRISILESK